MRFDSCVEPQQNNDAAIGNQPGARASIEAATRYSMGRKNSFRCPPGLQLLNSQCFKVAAFGL